MKKWLQRIRGAVGTALTWAVAWGGVGVILGPVVVLLSGWGPGVMVTFVIDLVARLAAAGFIGGAVFSTVLGVVEGRRRFDEMSLPRFATWGRWGVFSCRRSCWALGGASPYTERW